VTPPIFDEEALSALVLAWQEASCERQAAIWREIVEQTSDYLLTVIRSFKGDLRPLGTHEEIRAELVLKLHRVLSHYHPDRGRLFSLVTVSCLNHLRTLIEKVARWRMRHLSVDFSTSDPEVFGSYVQPEIYGLGAEIRARLDHFTESNGDFEFFLVRNLVVYCYGREGGASRWVPPTLEQIAGIVEEIVSLPADRALEQTRVALELLRNELSDFSPTHLRASEPGRPAKRSVAPGNGEFDSSM